MLVLGTVKMRESACLSEEHRNGAGGINGSDFPDPLRFLRYLQKMNFVSLYGRMGCGKWFHWYGVTFPGFQSPLPHKPVLEKVQLEKVQLGIQQNQKQDHCPEFPFHVIAGCGSASKLIHVH